MDVVNLLAVGGLVTFASGWVLLYFGMWRRLRAE